MILNQLISIIICFTFVHAEIDSDQGKFVRTIQAVGFPYYKILMSLGSCKDQVVYDEQRAWGTVRMNRIFDIRYQSQNTEYKVSRVEIILIINDTDCFAYSEMGIGSEIFTGTLFVPTKVSVILYHLTIYSCSEKTTTPEQVVKDTPHHHGKEICRSNEEEGFDIGPDRGPDHMTFS